MVGSVCYSGAVGGERAGREVVNASAGRVHLRQVDSASTHHSHWPRPTLSRYVTSPVD